MAGTRTPAHSHRAGRITAFRDHVRRRPGGALLWRIGITVLGVAIIVGGIILLPLPGPGWLIIFAGLGILGTEYAWAKRLLRWLRHVVWSWASWVALRPKWVQGLIGVAGLVSLAAVAYGAWLLYS